MLKYTDAFVVTAEIPDEIALAINISNCPHRCPGCHSPELREDIGTPLTNEELIRLVKSNEGVTCVCFMGGDSDQLDVMRLATTIKTHFNDIRTAWYTGDDVLPQVTDLLVLDYIKVGGYKEEFGPIDQITTNQRLYEIGQDRIIKDITSKFWNK